MKVRFEKLISFDDKYSCCCSDSIMATCRVDHTGEYRSASDYEALEAKLADLKEFQKLSAQSYDANVKGYQEDIARLKEMYQDRLLDIEAKLARLVEAADEYVKHYQKYGGHSYWRKDEIWNQLKAAIEAVKGGE